jgi:uncharacterized repeat protein (TIGR04076 family)
MSENRESKFSVRKRLRMEFCSLRATVTKQEGFCYHRYKVGDQFTFKDFTHPPQDFCLGAVHSMFPAMYALTFGAEFPFMENTKSLLTTCPDGKKVEFLIEVVDKEGRVISKPKPQTPPGPKPKTLEIEVKECTGKCFYGYKLGDKITVRGLKTPEGFCGAAYHMMFPTLFALNFGASYPFMENPNSLDTLTCPDGGHVVFKLTRKQEENGQ